LDIEKRAESDDSGAKTEMTDVAERRTENPDLTRDGEHLAPGTRVEVRKRFDSSWARGFEVAHLTDHGYCLRRLSDGSELPAEFSADDVRTERKRSSTWWY
jgi:hypothetical protein